MEMISVCFQCSVYWLMSVPLYNSAASIVSSSIQPLQNLSVLKYVEEKGGPDEKLVWVKYHIGKGFTALEKLLKDYVGQYATGDEVFLADLFIAPQVHAAIKRFNLDMECLPEEKQRLISELELSS